MLHCSAGGLCRTERRPEGYGQRREEVPYQLVGATRWRICGKDIHQGQKQHPHTSEDGQYYGSSVHKPPGRNEVPSLGSLSMSSLAVVPAQRDHTQQSIYLGHPTVQWTENPALIIHQQSGNCTPQSAVRSFNDWAHAKWTSLLWYPMLLESLIDMPILLTMHPDMLSNPFNERHPLMVHKKLQLAAWKLSGSNTELREFQKKASELIESGWSKGTNVAYQSAWNKWCGWCREQVDPISCEIHFVVNFLADLYAQGLQRFNQHYQISGFNDPLPD